MVRLIGKSYRVLLQSKVLLLFHLLVMKSECINTFLPLNLSGTQMPAPKEELEKINYNYRLVIPPTHSVSLVFQVQLLTEHEVGSRVLCKLFDHTLVIAANSLVSLGASGPKWL